MKKLLATFSMAYKKAPYYLEISKLLEQIASYQEKNMAKFIENSLRMICAYLDISTKILVSSDIEKTDGLVKDERVLDLCKRMQADFYINAIGGKELYRADKFLQNGITLKFIKMNPIEYLQFGGEFVPNLSIVDVLMFNDKETVKKMLKEYTLED